jgi:hypothetical protein
MASRRGEWARYVVALIAPRKRLGEPDTTPFKSQISYEEAGEQLSGDTIRRAFKRSILEYACMTAARPWVQVVDPEVTAWFRQARELAAREYPDLPLPLEHDRAATSTWIIFCPPGYRPARLEIEIKPAMGAIDLRFKGVALGDLRRAVNELLAPKMETKPPASRARSGCTIHRQRSARRFQNRRHSSGRCLPVRSSSYALPQPIGQLSSDCYMAREC